MVKSKYSKYLGFLVFCLGFMFMMCGAATAAASTTTTLNNISQTSQNHASNQLTAASQTQKFNLKSPDPQIYRNGVAVARGGHNAGYNFPSIATAISAAQSGDTIMLENGVTFYEHYLSISKNLNFNVFNNGHATIDGQNAGRIFTINGIVKLQNLTIKNGKSDNGGAILNNGNLIVTNCNFIGNTATGYGGAIRNSVGPLTIINSNFNSNKAADCGGAIMNDLLCLLSIKNCDFTSNSADCGGAITQSGSTYGTTGNSMNINNSNFISNTANNGGAIYYEVPDPSVLTYCNFKDNTATDDGGAIYTVGTSTYIDCAFSGNKATNGGAIYNNGNYAEGGNFIATKSYFIDNTATANGGAIYTEGWLPDLNMGDLPMVATITASIFTGNTAHIGGGAIYNVDSTCTVKDSSFNGNKANKGSAIYNDDTNSLNAPDNWWGSNNGPSSGIIYGKVSVKPWITKPVIVLTSPKNGATGFSRTAVIAIKFSENIKSSINWSKIELTNTGGHHVVITRSIAGNTIVIKAKSIRTANSWYIVTIPKFAVKDYSGNNLAANYAFRFKTGA